MSYSQDNNKDDFSINFWPGLTDISLMIILLLILFIFMQIIANTDAFKLQIIRDKQAKIEKLIKKAVGKDMRNAISFSANFDTQYITFSNQVLFRSGRADLQDIGKSLLTKVGLVLKGNEILFDNILIAGHTDTVPIKTRAFRSNWELSSGRATAVVNYFDEAVKLNNVKLSAIGYSQYQPIDPRETDEAKSKNRRIELTIKYSADAEFGIFKLQKSDLSVVINREWLERQDKTKFLVKLNESSDYEKAIIYIEDSKYPARIISYQSEDEIIYGIYHGLYESETTVNKVLQELKVRLKNVKLTVVTVEALLKKQPAEVNPKSKSRVRRKPRPSFKLDTKEVNRPQSTSQRKTELKAGTQAAPVADKNSTIPKADNATGK